MTKPPLTPSDFRRAASRLGCSVPAIMAVAEVESKGSGFLASGEPTILFEPHIFARYSNNKFNLSHPDLSYPKWKSGAYGAVTAQHGKLARAVALNRTAALMACSWGKFQVMGFNWQACGYPSLQAFVSAMYRSEADHLDAFVGYVIKRGLADELQRRDWAGFAYGYNGAGYAQNQYDVKMARAYARILRVLPRDFSNVMSTVTSTERIV